MGSRDTSGGNSGTLILIAAIVLFVAYSQRTERPDDGRKPEPETALAGEIRQAFAGDTDTAETYGAFYSICAASLGTETGADLTKLRAKWVKTKELLELQSPAAFGDIVSRELKDFEGARVDREKYAAALRRVSDACRKASGK